MTPRRLLLMILAVRLVLGLVSIAQLPPWDYHEAAYFNVVRFLRTEGRLPAEEELPEAVRGQATHPPLYFLVAYPIVALLDDGEPVPFDDQPLPFCIGDPEPNLTRAIATRAYTGRWWARLPRSTGCAC